jgi:hypothetical protein
MSNKISSCRHPLQQNSENSPRPQRRQWRAGRANGKGFTIINNAVIDYSNLSPGEFKLLTKIARFAHNETGEVTVEVGVLANEMGWKDRWTQKVKNRIVAKGFLGVSPYYDPISKRNYPNTYRLLNPHKPVETTAQKDTTPGVFKDTQVLKETLSSQTQYTPLPPQAGECVSVNEPEKQEHQRPVPSREVYESENHFRELRRERKAKSRSTRHRQAREEKLERRSGRCAGEVLTAFQRAALEVMSLCGVAATQWRVRNGIAAAMVLEVGENGTPTRCVEEMVIAWKIYLDHHGELRCPFGIEQFFVQGAWKDGRMWRWDESRRRL